MVLPLFSAVSQEFYPVDRTKLPAFLPSLPPPQVTEVQVYNKLITLKKTKSTLSMDIPDMLRKEISVELTAPLTHIINSSLNQQKYAALWKLETVSPVPKTTVCEELSDIRKIACTSDFNKLFELKSTYELFDYNRNHDNHDYEYE